MTISGDSPEGQRAVQTLEAIRKAEEKSTDVATIAKDIKYSLFFAENWDVLLCAAPYALEILGGLNAVAATKWAVETKVARPDGGFKYLTPQDAGKNYLQSALADLSNQSEETFSVARNKMFSIKTESGAVIQSVKLLIDILGDLEAPMQDVYLELNNISRGARSCKDQAGAIHDSATHFLKMAQELYVACRAENADVHTQREDILIKKKLAELDINDSKEREEKTKVFMDEMKANFDDAHDTYKRTLDEMPTGMTLVGQQILLGLGDTACRCLEIGANAVAAYYNPAGAGAGALKELNDIKKDNNTQAKANKHTTSATEEPKPQETPNSSILSRLTAKFPKRARPNKASQGETPKPEALKKDISSESTGKQVQTSFGNWDLSGKFDAKDPALKVVSGVKSAIESIKSVIVGSPSGVNWDAVRPPKDPTQGTVSSISLYSHTLKRFAKDFRPKEEGLASQLVVAIIDEGEQLCYELDEQLNKSKTLGSSPLPDTKSGIYKDWDTRISHLALVATTLDQAARSQPGSVPSAGTSLFKTPEDSAANMELRADIAEQTVRLATTKLTSAQTVYQTALESYKEATKNTLQAQKELSASIINLESLNAKELTLNGIKKVLIRCIAFLEQLKGQIDKLVQFFSNIAEFIRVCVESQVQPFEERIKQYGEKGDKAAFYTRYARDTIFKFSLRIVAHFSLFRDIATMYDAVDKKAIIPGITLVNEVGTLQVPSAGSEDGLFEQRKQALKQYRLGAEEAVKDVVQKKRHEIIGSLTARVENLANSLKELPERYLPAPQTKEALEDGAALAEASNREIVRQSAIESPVQAVMTRKTLESGDFDSL